MATNPALTPQARRRRDDPVVTGLVARARNGDRQAWDALVDRYAPLIWSICRSHRLDAADAQDAAQNVWLKLVDQLDNIRDPAALPGWLATTTRRECRRILRTARRACDAGYALAAGTIPDDHAQAAEQDLLAAERHAALQETFGQLPPGCPLLPVSSSSGSAGGGQRLAGRLVSRWRARRWPWSAAIGEFPDESVRSPCP